MHRTYEISKWVVQALAREAIRLLLRHLWERMNQWK